MVENVDKSTITLDITGLPLFKKLVAMLEELPDEIDDCKICSHEYDEDIGDLVRQKIIDLVEEANHAQSL